MTSPLFSAPLLPPGAARLGLGLAALGRPGYLNLGHHGDLPGKGVDDLRAQTCAVLDAAYGAGVRYFDAARSYGLAEAFLGGWLRERGPADAVTGSKWGYTYVAGWRADAPTHEVKTHDLPTLTRQWPETLEALGRAPHVYLIHSATPDSGVLEDTAVLARLAELAAAGVRVGLSTSGPRQADTVRRALAAQVNGVNPFRAVQATWNLLDPSAGEALAEAHAAGWTVVVKEGVANGRLSARGLTGRGDVPPELAGAARALGVTPDAVALGAALAHPWADVVLSGAVTPEQLAQNLAALPLRVNAAALTAPLAQPPEQYWQARSALTWT
ncbi:aldo/keto reductase [Deinococcus taeanensis]|uniref:aldo/keto reductase n=1 Tax=Deinococcus taeanensis TaxID=2737050 RepID=UPI001CDD57D2|nr:aldo/keto reductase [Deinococcus taeanensis]UBV42685.1 aldo/keto reductase [Deinococcus taeanensis]